ncbi:MAG TPA: protein translocase subunit SecD, partial [Porticoccaceae bacterium]|nr:protein translocase subunit SecD [Porticoccaceae bacterium]
MNRYPLWKYLLIVAVVALGFTYAAPNLYAPDPAIQISGQSGAMVMDQAVLDKALSRLNDADIAYFGESLDDKSVLIRLKDGAQQLAAKRQIQEALGLEYVVALNLADNTPDALASMGATPMKLGLDLSGGVHFLMQVDTDSVITKHLETQLNEIKKALRESKTRYKKARLEGSELVFTFADAEQRDEAQSLVRRDFRDLLPLTSDTGEEGQAYRLSLSLSEVALKEKIDYAVGQNLTTLRNRVNELGVSEPIVQ